jgi:membrane protease YdiL (CAAX protease family)
MFSRKLDLFSFFLLLTVVVLCGALMGAGIGTAIANIFGFSVTDLVKVPVAGYQKMERDVLRWVNMASQLFTFLMPALLYRTYYFKEERVGATFVADKFFYYFFILAPFWVIGSFPFVEWLYRQNLLLPLPESLISLERSANATLMALLKMEDFVEFIQNLIVMAAIPALCEEWLFRGVIQKKLIETFPKPWMGILMTAIIFSAIHLQFAGFIPRVFLGILLGYLYFFSGNIWISIWGHFAFNGIQVLSKYLNLSSEEIAKDGFVPNPTFLWVLLSFGFTLVLFLFFRKLKAR